MIDFEIQNADKDLKEQSFQIHLDSELLWNEGRQLMKKLLLTLNTYRTSGSHERATKFMDQYSTVDNFEQMKTIR